MRLALGALAALAAGCAPHLPPKQVAAPPRPVAGYDRLVDSLGAVDASGLLGKRIVLDPGHGGLFRGALGVHGLTEAEVNLGVALRLRDLLQHAGARVETTRDTDRDYLTPQDSSLRSDLAERVRIANAFQPDLFLSVHHNADPGGRHDVNETQTYYRLGDEGPSLDAAQDVHRSLVRNVGIPANKVVAGNYYVLRNSNAPALLTETSYITNPDVEAKLRRPEKQELEAQALYLGVARYFARPVPRIVELLATDPVTGRGDSVLTGDVELRARVDGEFDEAELSVDDTPVDPVRSGSILTWRAVPALAQGPHRATLKVRLTGVGAARELTTSFVIQRPPAALTIETRPERAPWPGGALGLRVEVLDAEALPDPDSAAVRIVVRLASRGAAVAASRARSHALPRKPLLDTLVTARDGAAWAYAWAPARQAVEVRATRVSPASSAAHARGVLPAITATRRVASGSRAWTGFARSMPADIPLAGAPGTREPDPELHWINRDGFVALERDSSGEPLVPQLPGYRMWAHASGDRDPAPAYVAIAGGALAGRRIVLDPDAGGDQPGGVGKSGTRAANLNLEVARALAALLRAAGAKVRLTREGDVALSELERVQISEAFHADRFLRIGHRPEPPRIGYYFSSAAGHRWADQLRAACSRMGLPAPDPAEDAQYPLQQTSCPSLYASLARIDDPASEDRLLAQGAMHTEAWGLWLGLAREWESDSAWVADSVVVRDDAGKPLAGATVRLGGALVTETNALGVARFVRTEAGPLEVEVHHPRLALRRVLLNSEHGAVLTGPSEP